MTRRDYIRIAAALQQARIAEREVWQGSGRVMALRGVYAAADALADMLAADNPRFDRDRFMRAAGGES